MDAWINTLPWPEWALLSLLLLAYFFAVLYSWRFGLYCVAVLLPFQGLLGTGGLLSAVKIAIVMTLISVVPRVSASGAMSRRFIAVLRVDLVMLVFGLVIWSFLSILWAQYPHAAFVKSSTYLGDLVLLILIAMLDQSTLKRFFWVLLGAWTVVVPTGLLVVTFNSYALHRFTTAGLYTAGGYNPDDFGTLLAVFGLLLFFGFGLREKRALKIAILGIFAIGLFFSKTLTAVVVLACTPLLVILSEHRGDKFAATMKAIVSYLVVGMALTVVLAYTPTGQYLAQTKYSRLAALSADSAWDGRLNIWQGGLEMFREHPLIGTGSGNFPYLSPEYSAFAAHVQRDTQAFTDKFSTGSPAHNMYLSISAELGIVGLILFLSVLVLAFSRSAHLFEKRELSAGMHAALCALLIGGCALNWEYSKFLFLVIGAIVADSINRRVLTAIQANRQAIPDT